MTPLRIDRSRRHLAPTSLLAAAAAIVSGLAASALAAGPDWDEVGDAGRFPSGAQILFGTGAVQTLAGSLGVLALAGDDDDDGQDMYRLVIVDPVRIGFSAGTAPRFGGEAGFDTRLWLFDADGGGLLANDDSNGFQSGFFEASDDGTEIVLDQPGVYFLAVSSAKSEPLDQFGQPLFLFGSSTEISGPDGPGGAGAIAQWSDDDSAGGYIIGITGAGFSPVGDLDGDGDVDGADLGAFLAAWGACPVLGSCPADLDFSGAIDGADLGLLLGGWS